MVCEVQTMRESPLYTEGIGPELIEAKKTKLIVMDLASRPTAVRTNTYRTQETMYI